ncbi:MAG TPA: hypothetical protein VFD46_14250 [Chryseolinea sp.]|nr:hypothetical protein [Chryseolinea sp.]
MEYKLTDFTAKELNSLIKENKGAIQKRNDEIEVINQMDYSETKYDLIQKRYAELTIFTQLQVMLLTALQEVKMRESVLNSYSWIHQHN